MASWIFLAPAPKNVTGRLIFCGYRDCRLGITGSGVLCSGDDALVEVDESFRGIRSRAPKRKQTCCLQWIAEMTQEGAPSWRVTVIFLVFCALWRALGWRSTGPGRSVLNISPGTSRPFAAQSAGISALVNWATCAPRHGGGVLHRFSLFCLFHHYAAARFAPTANTSGSSRDSFFEVLVIMLVDSNYWY